MENKQILLCEMQIQGQTHQAASSLETIQVLKSLETIQGFCNFSASFCILCVFILQKFCGRGNLAIVRVVWAVKSCHLSTQLSRSLAKGAHGIDRFHCHAIKK